VNRLTDEQLQDVCSQPAAALPSKAVDRLGMGGEWQRKEEDAKEDDGWDA